MPILYSKARQEKFLESLPLPAWNVWRMVEDAKRLAGEAYVAREKAIGDDFGGTIADWEQTAERTLRKEIRQMIRQGGDPDGSLEQQMLAVFPDERPPRDLDQNELTELRDIQE